MIKEKKTKIRNAQWILLANVAQSFLSLTILVSLARLGSKEEVGLFSYLQGVLLPIQLFFTLKLRTVECSDVDDKNSAREYHVVRRLCATLNFFLGAVVIFVFIERSATFLAFALLLSYSLLIVRESIGSVFIKNGLGFGFFVSNALNAVFSVLFFIASYSYYNSLTIAVLFLFLGRAFSYFLIEVPYFKRKSAGFKRIQRKITKNAVRNILISGVPLGGTALVGALFSSLPKIVIEGGLGVESLAVYTTVTSLLFAFNLLVNSYVQSAMTKYSFLYRSSYKEYCKRVSSSIAHITALAALAAVFVYLGGGWVLSILFGSEYYTYGKEFLMVVFSGYSLGLFSIGNLMLSSQGSYGVQFPIYVFILFCLFCFSFPGMNWFGVSGVIFSQAISYLLGFLVCVVFFLRKKGDLNDRDS